jgi:hypothetical protein
MYRFFSLFIFFAVSNSLLFSQKIITSKGSAQIEIPDNLSRNEVKNKVRELATIDALERAFGRVIIQGNSTSVKGEVLEIRNEKFTDIPGTIIIDGRKEPVTEMRCDIEVRAREIVTPPVNFTSFPLGCTDVKCRTTAFKNNDILYLYFISPVSGYISVYLDDRNETQCLYPYSTMPVEFEGGVPVSADKKYILFSDKPEFNYFPGKNFTPDTYQLFTNSIQDMNRLFVIFSKTPLNKPSLSGVTELDDGYLLPKSLASEDFQKWMNTYRSHEKANVQVEIIDITISK